LDTQKQKKTDIELMLQIALVIVLIGLIAFNLGRGSAELIPASSVDSVPSSKIIPAGLPRVYGAELGISYDDVSPSNPGKADATIEVMSRIDRSVQLEGSDLQ